MLEWAAKRRITIIHAQQGNPQQNAYVECYNRTVRYDWLAQNLLKAWCAEFEANRTFRKGYQRVKRRNTDEQKQKAVDHYVEQGHCLAQTIRRLGYQQAVGLFSRSLRIFSGQIDSTFGSFPAIDTGASQRFRRHVRLLFVVTPIPKI